MNNYQVDKNGFYGEFGGAYVPEILYKCVHDLQEAYLPIIESARRICRLSRVRSSRQNIMHC